MSNPKHQFITYGVAKDVYNSIDPSTKMPFESGEIVIICLKKNSLISRRSLESNNFECPFCRKKLGPDLVVIGSANPSKGKKSEPQQPSRRQSPSPLPTFLFGGMSVFMLLCLVVSAIGVFNLMSNYRGGTSTPKPVTLVVATSTSIRPRPSSTPIPTNTPKAPPAIAITNYLNFTTSHQWSVKNITKITGMTLSPDKQKIALFTLRSSEQWWLELRGSENGNLFWEVNVGKAAYNALAFSPDGNLIGTGTEEGKVRIWDIQDGSLIHTLEGHVFPVRYLAFSPDGTMIASGASDNTARVWQVSNGISLTVYNIKTDVRDIAWSSDSQYLAVTSNNINVYDVPSRTDDPYVFYDNTGDTRDLGEVSFSPGSAFLIGAGEWLNPENNRWRYRIFVWDFPLNKTTPLKIPLDDAIDDVVISSDGQVLIGTYKDKGKLLLIDIAAREIKGSIDIGPTLYMSNSRDMSMFAIVTTKTTVTLWEVSP